MPLYIILMTENDDSWDHLDATEQDRLLQRYYAWVEELKQKDQLRGGDPVGGPGRVLRQVDGTVVEAPYAESKGVLTGYFIVEAEDLAGATRIARGCPALEHGEAVTIRPVGRP